MAFDKEYVFRDCEIICRAMSFAWTFALELGLEKLPTTYAGLGILLWKAWGGECAHDSLEFSRDAIFGGRVELFKAHNETMACWTDMNSLYPFVMQGEYPGELEDYGRRLPAFGIVNATVRAPETDLAVLPWRSPAGKSLYPWGKFTGVWTVPELRLAEAEGVKILKVNEAWGCGEGVRPYADYVQRLYSARMQAETGAEKLFFKFLMNCRYGRMGMQGKVGRTVWQTAENCQTGVPFGDKVLLELNLPLPPETNWGHAAYTAALGRIELFKYLKLCGARRLIYADTDAVIWDCPENIPFATGDGLGQMRLVQWVKECETFAPKVYRVDENYRAKGIPRAKAREFIEQEHVEFDIPFRFREAIAYYDDKDKRGLLRWPNTHRLSVWHREMRKMRRNYDRKILHGNRYFPLQVRQSASK
jgi:hypothetical protein